MKKLSFLLPLMFTLNVFSQIERPVTQGNLLICGGGTIQYSTRNTTIGSNTQKQNLFSVSLNPGMAYFFIDNLAIGLNTDFVYYSQGNNKYYSLGIGPSIKYYFGNGILLKGESNFSGLYTLGENDTYKNHYFTFKPGVGYAFFINQKVSLEPSINYEFNSYKEIGDGNEYTAKTNSLQLEFTIVVFL